MRELTASAEDAASLYSSKPAEPAVGREAPPPLPTVVRQAGRLEDISAWAGMMSIIAGLFVFFFIASERLVGPLVSSHGGAQELSLAALYMLNVRSNAAFLVGSFIAMTGAMLVLKGARARVSGGVEHAAEFRASLVTDSPGLFLGVMGTVIIIVTLFRGGSLEVTPALRSHEPSHEAASRDAELGKNLGRISDSKVNQP